GTDLREHKVTLPLIAALPHMSAGQRSRVEALFANPTPDDQEIAEVVAVVADCGGLEFARRRGEEYAVRAEAALDGIPDSEARQSLADAINYVLDRRS
ncbi:MAG: octaprenyl-diphosphate synthase, partial [Gemmatimonadetes bacterium]|nr:octaprenyl-diphosphate synthase [Gemmatimonadota bacterium]